VRRFFAASFRKDLRRTLADPVALVIGIAIPLGVGLLLGLISSGNQGSPTARLLVVDQDETFVSGFLVAALGQGQLGELIETEEVDEATGRARMDDGKASGLLLIPEGFMKDLYDREPTTLTLLTNPSQIILPGILEGVLGTMVDFLSEAQFLLGDVLDQVDLEPAPGQNTPTDEAVATTSLAINQLVERASPYFFPPAIKVEMAIEEAEEDEGFDLGKLFFPSMLFMSLMFLAQGRSDDVWKEWELGTLRRTVTTPGSLTVFLLGKIAAGGLVLGGIVALALFFGRWVLGIEFEGIPLAAAWGALSGVFLLLLFTGLQTLASSPQGGNLLTGVLVFPLIMLGGAFFPFEAMGGLAAVGRLTPNGWLLTVLKGILDGSTPPGSLAVSTAVAMGATAFLFYLVRRRLAAFARA